MIITHITNAGYLSAKRYKVIQPMSSCPMSQVDLVKSLDTGQMLVSKLHKSNSADSETCKLLQEAQMIQQLSHKNLIDLQYFDEHGEYIEDKTHSYNCMVYLTEYYPQGDLLTLVCKNPNGLDNQISKSIFKQIMLGLDHMHQRNIAHGDIRLENCVFTNDRLIKLIDFEFWKPAYELSSVFEGSNYYMAPEIISHEEYYPNKADIFAAGCVLFGLVFGCPAFEDASLTDKNFWTLENRSETFWNRIESRKKHIKYDLKYLLENLLSINPEERMSCSDILNDPWMRT